MICLEIDIAVHVQELRACGGGLHSHFPIRSYVCLVQLDLRGLRTINQYTRGDREEGRLTLDTLGKYLQFAIKMLVISISLYH